MKPEIFRVSHSYARGSDFDLLATATSVLKNLYGNPAFPDPPVSYAVFSKAVKDMKDAKAVMAQAGTAATAAKNQRSELVDLMRILAGYVTSRSKSNLAILLSSGFKPCSNNRTRVQLPAPINLRAKLDHTGQALLTVGAVKNARSYQTEYSLIGDDGIPGPWIGTRSTNQFPQHPGQQPDSR